LAIPARTRLARLLAGAGENTSQSAMARLPAKVLDLHVDGKGPAPGAAPGLGEARRHGTSCDRIDNGRGCREGVGQRAIVSASVSFLAQNLLSALA
jgi:hypothetical protein